MTVLEDVEALLTRIAPDALCDLCIGTKLGLSPPNQHANHKTIELAKLPGFDRRKDVCSSCGSNKLVISAL